MPEDSGAPVAAEWGGKPILPCPLNPPGTDDGGPGGLDTDMF